MTILAGALAASNNDNAPAAPEGNPYRAPVDIAQFSLVAVWSVQPGVTDFAQFSRIGIYSAAPGVTDFAQFSRIVIYSEA